jgi:hypothetical protein
MREPKARVIVPGRVSADAIKMPLGGGEVAIRECRHRGNEAYPRIDEHFAGHGLEGTGQGSSLN